MRGMDLLCRIMAIVIIATCVDNVYAGSNIKPANGEYARVKLGLKTMNSRLTVLATEADYASMLDALGERLKKSRSLSGDNMGRGAKSVVISSQREYFYVDVSKTSCEEATKLVERYLLNTKKLRIGVGETGWQFDESDVAEVKRDEPCVAIVLTPAAAEMLYQLSSQATSRLIRVVIDGRAKEVQIPIKEAIETGSILVDSSDVPAGFEKDFDGTQLLVVRGCTQF
jgi:hypothetical protein